MGGKVMSASYRTFFGLKKDPFTQDIERKEILETAAIKGVQSRILHAVEIGASTLLTGDIGSGKSTALRYNQYLTIKKILQFRYPPTLYLSQSAVALPEKIALILHM
jgi:type II secretory pathway predicted ATPase ExeA